MSSTPSTTTSTTGIAPADRRHRGPAHPTTTHPTELTMPSPLSPRSDRRHSVAGALAIPVAGLVVGVAMPASSHAVTPPPSDAVSAEVVTDWNRITFRTYAEPSPAIPQPVQALYTGFVGAAVHDAVATIDRAHAPYVPHNPARPGASVEAAAATAAYRVLSALVPTSATTLAADHRRWLDRVPDGPAEDAGVEVGEDAAAAVLAARSGDGRGAPVTLTTTPGPGVWDVPPSGMLAPWLGFVRPMVLPSARSIRLTGPDPLRSRRYARDVEEVRRMGAKNGSERTADQTETALFYTANVVQQYNAALSDRLTRHHADASTAARHLALLNLATADAVIATWRAKYVNHSWRPQQAIRRADTDGNRRTVADPTWEPLVPNPPYPEYASGHAAVSGAASGTLAALYGPCDLDVTVASSATRTVRHYDSAAALDRDTENARIWLGLHFRKAVHDGNRAGHAAAAYTVRHALGALDR
jgi:hypothetical protein